MIKSVASEVTLGAISKVLGFTIFSWVLSEYGFSRSVDKVIFASTICFAVIGFFGGIFYATVFTPISINYGRINSDTASIVDFLLKNIFYLWIVCGFIITILYVCTMGIILLDMKLIILCSFHILFGITYELLNQVCKSIGKYFLVNFSLLCVNILSFTCLVFIVDGPEIILLWQIIAYFLLTILLYCYLSSNKYYNFFSHKGRTEHYAELIKVIPPVSLQGLLGIFANVTPFIISFQLAPGLISSYSLLRRIYDTFSSIVVVPAVTVLSPLISDNYVSLRRKHLEIIIIYIFAPLSFGPFIFRDELSVILISYFEDIPSLAFALSILMISILPNSLNAVFTRSLLQKRVPKKLYLMNLLTIVPAILIPVMTYVLGNKYGLIGVCLAYTLYHVIFHAPLAFYLDFGSYKWTGSFELLNTLLKEIFLLGIFSVPWIVLKPSSAHIMEAFVSFLGFILFYYIIRFMTSNFLRNTIRALVTVQLGEKS